MANWPSKRAAEVLDYSVDWSAVLAEDGDTITTATWIVPVGLTKGDEQLESGVMTVMLSGGTAQTTYSITSRIATAGGRTHERVNSLAVT